jgi:hypothetical protein
MSDDGRIVVGTTIRRVPAASGYSFDRETRGFRWVVGDRLDEIGTFRSDNGGDSIPYATNRDGSIVVGAAETDSGAMRGFIWRANRLLDHENTLAQIADHGQRQATAVSSLGDTLGFVLDQEVPLAAPAAPTVTRGPGRAERPVAMRLFAAAGGGDDAQGTALAGVSASVGLSTDLVLGGTLFVTSGTSDLDALGIDGSIGSLGLWLRRLPRGGARPGTGLTWKLAAAGSGGDVTLERPDGGFATEAGQGDSRLTGWLVYAEAGYVLERNGRTLTPFARLSHGRAQRDGFTEEGDALFPVSYDAYEIAATVATLGLDAQIPVGTRGTLGLLASLEADLFRSQDDITGESEIFGLESFSAEGPKAERSVRGTIGAGYRHDLGNGRSLDVAGRLFQPVYADAPSWIASAGYMARF